MIHLTRWMRRIQAWTHRDDAERGMDAEMRLHLELEAQDLQLQGMSAQQARQRAAIAFGGVERFKDEAREARPSRLVENLTRDIQLALRQLKRSRGFALSAATLLAVGIGGTAAVFSVLNAIHFRPLPYPNADRLSVIQVRMSDPRCGERCLRDPDADELQLIRSNVSSIEKLGSIRVTQGVAFLPGGTQLLKGAAISESLGELLDFRPALGRALTPPDFRPDAPGVMVLSYSAWLTEFGGDSSVVGRAVTMDEETFTVAGVLRRSAELGSPLYAFNSPNTAQYFVADRGTLTKASSNMRVIAQLREGRSLLQINAQIDALLKPRVASGAGSLAMQGRANVGSMRAVLASNYRSSFWTLFAAVGLVLIITCLNVTGLFLARLTDRANELATRTALGASRFRLAQQMGTETLVIAVAGGLGGLFLAFLGTLALRALPAGRLPFWSDVAIDSSAILLTALLTVAAGTLLSIAPIFVLSPSRLLLSLRETISASRSRSRLRHSLVALQIAFSVVLLGAAGLLTKVLIDAELRDTGTTKHSMLYVFLQPATFSSDADELSRQQRVIDEVRKIPGVTAVAVEGTAPRTRAPNRSAAARSGDRSAPRPAAMSIEGRPDALPATIAPSSADEVSPAYFDAMGIRIVRGRAFNVDDRLENAAVAIVDEPTARRLFGTENPIGKRVKFGEVSSQNPWMTIVGVTAALVNNALEPNAPYRPQLYRSILQFPAAPQTAIVRLSTNSYNQKRAIKEAIKTADPSLPVVKMISIEESIGQRLFTARFNTWVLSAFALFAVLLSCLGVYAAVTISITSRQREIAIRIALGAIKREVAILLVRSTTRPVIVGLIAGLIASTFATRTLRSILYGTSPTDPSVYALVAATMLLTSTIAALIPARRAVNADPARALRS